MPEVMYGMRYAAHSTQINTLADILSWRDESDCSSEKCSSCPKEVAFLRAYEIYGASKYTGRIVTYNMYKKMNELFDGYVLKKHACKNHAFKHAQASMSRGSPGPKLEPLDEEHAADVNQASHGFLDAAQSGSSSVCTELGVRLCDLVTTTSNRDADLAAFLAELASGERAMYYEPRI